MTTNLTLAASRVRCISFSSFSSSGNYSVQNFNKRFNTGNY